MNVKKSKSELKDRIWKIRDYIQELEDAKDGIIDYLNPTKKKNDKGFEKQAIAISTLEKPEIQVAVHGFETYPRRA